jgi:hypothetical protein
MSREKIRVDIVTAISALKAGFPGVYPLVIEYDNITAIDTQYQTDPYLRVDIKFIDMSQADISDNPTHRVHGQILLAAAVKEGAGTKAANQILDYFYPKLQRKGFGMVRTHMATVAPETPHLGWVYFPVIVPFWSDIRYGAI